MRKKVEGWLTDKRFSIWEHAWLRVVTYSAASTTAFFFLVVFPFDFASASLAFLSAFFFSPPKKKTNFLTIVAHICSGPGGISKRGRLIWPNRRCLQSPEARQRGSKSVKCGFVSAGPPTLFEPFCTLCECPSWVSL